MTNPSDARLRAILGPTLQAGALRAVLFLGAFAVVGALCAWLLH